MIVDLRIDGVDYYEPGAQVEMKLNTLIAGLRNRIAELEGVAHNPAKTIEHLADEQGITQLEDLAAPPGVFADGEIEQILAERERERWQDKIFSHKHLDPQCVESGCQSLFLKIPGLPDGMRISHMLGKVISLYDGEVIWECVLTTLSQWERRRNDDARL